MVGVGCVVGRHRMAGSVGSDGSEVVQVIVRRVWLVSGVGHRKSPSLWVGWMTMDDDFGGDRATSLLSSR